MTLKQAKLFLYTIGILQLIYIIPLTAIYYLARWTIQVLDYFREVIDNKFWDNVIIRQEAMKIIALDKIEQRKESVRRKRAMAQEIK